MESERPHTRIRLERALVMRGCIRSPADVARVRRTHSLGSNESSAAIANILGLDVYEVADLDK